MSQPRVLSPAAAARAAAAKANEVETEPEYDPSADQTSAPPVPPSRAQPMERAASTPSAQAGPPARHATPFGSPDDWVGSAAVHGAAGPLPAVAGTQSPAYAVEEYGVPQQAASAETSPDHRYPPGPGRPPVPRPQDILHLRKLSRSSLSLTVPDALELPKRLKRYCLDRDVDVVGDAVAVALDAWLSAQGY